VLLITSKEPEVISITLSEVVFESPAVENTKLPFAEERVNVEAFGVVPL
jgi:hypothetical protein